MTKIIGIDPGLAATGIGIISATKRNIDQYGYEVIQTPKHMPLPKRLQKIYETVLQILKDEKPELMVVEDIFSLPKYPASGITLGKVSGVILLAGCNQQLPVIEIPVREAKFILTGNGNASKSQLEMAVRRTLSLNQPIKSAHASDAIALAIIGLHRYHKPGGTNINDRVLR